jgi:hypothetical protein
MVRNVFVVVEIKVTLGIGVSTTIISDANANRSCHMKIEGIKQATHGGLKMLWTSKKRCPVMAELAYNAGGRSRAVDPDIGWIGGRTIRANRIGANGFAS